MVFGFPLSDMTQFYVTTTLFNTGRWTQDKWITQADVSGLSDRFAGYEDDVRKVVELLPNDGSTMGWSLWQMPPARNYFKGRVAMLGDAAPASTPLQGAGAGQAIEDALVMEQLLGKCLDPTRYTKSHLQAAVIAEISFRAYDTVRRYRSQKVVTTSHEVPRIYTGNEPGVGERAADIEERLKGSQDWIWDCDQERQVKDAIQLFDASYAGATRAAEGRQ
jgi:salicylate hydroxylase